MRIIGIARGLDHGAVIPAFEAALEGGITFLEITMNTHGALKQIEMSAAALKGQAQIGAGTVMTLEQARQAIRAGAEFIVSPHTDIQIINYCKEKRIPVYPGALTPTEVWSAWTAGAEMVKVFPVSRVGGADYIKDLKGPLNSVRLLACGGVRSNNYSQFLEAGAEGIALGGSLFNPRWIAQKDWKSIRSYAEEFTYQ